jgi:RNA-directed DNA polymerase
MQYKIAVKTKNSNTKIINSDVKNLMGSYISNIFLVIYAINQILIYKDTKTLNVDCIPYNRYKSSKTKACFENAANIALKINHQFLKDYKSKTVNPVYTSKLNYVKSKLLSTPTLLDQVIQKMFQLVIEPAIDVLADSNSYGFRKHRSCHNAIGALASKLTKASETLTIMSVNIEKFFDTIDHNWIKTHFPMPTSFENVLESWLNCGILEGNSFYLNEYKVSQNKIIPFLIANFTLDGLETAAFKGVTKLITTSDKNKKILSFKFNLIRYTDEFVIVLNYPRNLELIKKNVEEFLNIRGLQINKKKFKHIYFSLKKNKKEEPSPKFNFLGFTFMYQSNVRLSRIISRKDMTNCKKVIISPSRQNVLSFKKKLKTLISKNSNLTAIELLQKLNPILRNWATYFSMSISEKIFSEIDNYVYRRL